MELPAICNNIQNESMSEWTTDRQIVRRMNDSQRLQRRRLSFHIGWLEEDHLSNGLFRFECESHFKLGTINSCQSTANLWMWRDVMWSNNQNRLFFVRNLNKEKKLLYLLIWNWKVYSISIEVTTLLQLEKETRLIFMAIFCASWVSTELTFFS